MGDVNSECVAWMQFSCQEVNAPASAASSFEKHFSIEVRDISEFHNNVMVQLEAVYVKVVFFRLQIDPVLRLNLSIACVQEHQIVLLIVAGEESKKYSEPQLNQRVE